MDKFLKYSVLRYEPSIVSGEKLNLGLLVDAQDGTNREFRTIKKYTRVSNFDDELDIDRLKALLSGIQDDLSETLFTREAFNIDKYTKFFINEFKFDSPKTLKYDDWEEAVATLYKSYFRFEFKKSERPSKSDDRALLKRIISNSWDDTKYNEALIGPFNEYIRYDFVTDDFKIKLFDFDNKDLSKLIQSAKAWAWNSENDKDKNLIIIYRYSQMDDENSAVFDAIKSIFKKANAQFLAWDDGMELIQKKASSGVRIQ